MMSNEAVELLPCPLCGIHELSEGPPTTDDGGVYVDRWAIHCVPCDLRLTVPSIGDEEWPDKARERAFTAWNARQAPAWVPVGERLPTESGDYLVANEFGGKQILEVLNFSVETGYFRQGGGALAWMPLPEPFQTPVTDGEETK